MKKYIVSWAVLFAIYFVAVAVWINYAPAATQIGTNQIKNSAITNPKIANDAVTEAKFDSASGITVATAAITGAATASKLVSTGDIVAAATGSFADIDVSDHIGAARADIGDLTVSGSCTGCGGGGGSLADAMNVGATAPVALDMRGFDITHFAAVASGTTEFRYNADILSAGILGFEINEGSALYFPSAASGEIFIGAINLFGAAGFTITNGAGNPVIEIVNDQNSNTAGIGVGGTGSNGTIQVRNNAGAANITLGGGTGNAGFEGNLSGTGTLRIGRNTGSSGSDVNFYGTYGGLLNQHMFYNASQGAFAVGYDGAGTIWDDGMGYFSFASGYNTDASGPMAHASGYLSTASGFAATAMGQNTTASGDVGTALGYDSVASGFHSTAIGESPQATGFGATAIGTQATASGKWSLAMGTDPTASGTSSVAIGYYVTASATNSITIGQGTTAGIRVINNTPSSLMIGFESTVPTLFVGPGSGVGTYGKVGVGTTTPAVMLDVNGDVAASGTIVLNAAGAQIWDVSAAGNETATGTINAIGGYKVGAAIGVTCTLTMDLSATATVSITKGIITGCTGPACSCP